MSLAYLWASVLKSHFAQMRPAKALSLTPRFLSSSLTAAAASRWSCKRMNCSPSPLSPPAAKAATRRLPSPSPSHPSTRMTSTLVSFLHYNFNLVPIFISRGEILPGKPVCDRGLRKVHSFSSESLIFYVTSGWISAWGPYIFQCQQKPWGLVRMKEF